MEMKLGMERFGRLYETFKVLLCYTGGYSDIRGGRGEDGEREVSYVPTEAFAEEIKSRS